MSTPIRGISTMAGSDAANTIDDTYTSGVTLLDAALFWASGTLAARPTASTAKRGTAYVVTDQPGYIYLSDGTNWIEAAPGAGALPIGAMAHWFGSSDPADTRWVIADGRTLSQTTYPVLYAMIGTLWDLQDHTTVAGAGLFRIPKMNGRFPIAPGAVSLGSITTRTAGNSGGEETHTLVTSESPSHSHSLNGFGRTPVNGTSPTVNVLIDTGSAGTGGAAIGSDNTGGGGAHNNMPPYVVVAHIIRIA